MSEAQDAGWPGVRRGFATMRMAISAAARRDRRHGSNARFWIRAADDADREFIAAAARRFREPGGCAGLRRPGRHGRELLYRQRQARDGAALPGAPHRGAAARPTAAVVAASPAVRGSPWSRKRIRTSSASSLPASTPGSFRWRCRRRPILGGMRLTSAGCAACSTAAARTAAMASSQFLRFLREAAEGMDLAFTGTRSRVRRAARA